MPINSKPGQILILFLTLMSFCLLLSTALISLKGAAYRDSRQTVDAKEAHYLAEAGLDKGFLAYKSSQTYTGETFSLGNGSVQVTIANGATANEKIINSIATVADKTRRLRAKLSTTQSGTAIAFSYALQAGSGGFSIGNNSIINGNVYSNQNISGGNNSVISGDAYAVGTITGVTVQGQRLTGQPVQPLPAFDQNFWRGKAQEGGTINGNYSPVNNSTLGPLYIAGNLSFGNQVNVTITGPVYVTGEITFGNQPVLTVSDSLGSSGTMLISERNVFLGNGITVTNNQQNGYLLMVSTLIGGTAISIGNSALAINAPLYAPYGTLSIGNNARAIAFAAYQVITGTGAIITYDEGLALATYSGGPGGTWTFQKGSLQEY